MGNLVPSSAALAFLSNRGEKHKSPSPSAVQVKNWRKTISNEEKLDIISQLEKGEHIVDICHVVRFVCISLRTVRENADRIKESATSGIKEFV
jgi:hypothetical protein